MSTKPAPKWLGDAGRALWRSIASRYDLRPDEYTVLTRACEVEDRVVRLREALDDAGTLISVGSMGQEVEHPMLTALVKHEALQQRLLGALKLPDEATGAKLNQQREAGKSRWRPHTA